MRTQKFDLGPELPLQFNKEPEKRTQAELVASIFSKKRNNIPLDTEEQILNDRLEQEEIEDRRIENERLYGRGH